MILVVGFTCDTDRVQQGIIYFKNKEDVIKAVEILGDKVKRLFD